MSNGQHSNIKRTNVSKNTVVLLANSRFSRFPGNWSCAPLSPEQTIIFLRRAPLHRFASRPLFIYPGTNGWRTADVGGQRRRTTLLVPHKRDTRIAGARLALPFVLARYCSPAAANGQRAEIRRRELGIKDAVASKRFPGPYAFLAPFNGPRRLPDRPSPCLISLFDLSIRSDVFFNSVVYFDDISMFLSSLCVSRWELAQLVFGI